MQENNCNRFKFCPASNILRIKTLCIEKDNTFSEATDAICCAFTENELQPYKK